MFKPVGKNEHLLLVSLIPLELEPENDAIYKASELIVVLNHCLRIA